MEILKKKLSSRKLWVTIAAFVTALLVNSGASETEVELIIGAITALAPAIVYVVSESILDAKAIGKEIEAAVKSGEVATQAIGFAIDSGEDK